MSIPQRYGITFPFDGIPLVDQREIVRELVDLGYTDLWSAESGGYDAFTPLAVAAQWAPELRFGTAIVPVYTRGAHTLGVDRRVDVPGRARPVRARHRHVVRRDRRTVERDARSTSRTSACATPSASCAPRSQARRSTRSTRRSACAGFRLGITVPEQPPILVAALREGMLRLAGREGDGAIINWLSADDVKTVVPHVGADNEIVGAHLRVAGRRCGAGARGGQARDRVVSHRARLRRVPRMAGPGRRARRPLAALEGRRPQGGGRIDSRLTSSTSCSCGAHPRACKEHIARYMENGVTTPAPALFCGPDQLRAVLARSLA